MPRFLEHFKGLILGAGGDIMSGKCKGSPLRKSQYRLSQPPLVASVPLSRFTSRVGGGAAFYVSCK
jgi:hypothetical protein